MAQGRVEDMMRARGYVFVDPLWRRGNEIVRIFYDCFFGIPDIREYTKEYPYRLIFIVLKDLTVPKDLEGRVEVFSVSFFDVDHRAHPCVAQYAIASVPKALPEHLPILKWTDPARRFWGWRAGTILDVRYPRMRLADGSFVESSTTQRRVEAS